MSNYFFQKRIMASENVVAYERSVLYYVSATPTEITQGALLKLTDRATSVFGTSDLTTYKAIKPAADTDPIYIADILETPYATLGSNNYRVGVELSNLRAPANTPIRVRKPKLDDVYIIGADNFASAPTVGEWAIPTAGSVLYTPSGSEITTKHCVLIEEVITVGFGVSTTISAYVVRVVTEK
jgi:hypothetical protein